MIKVLSIEELAEDAFVKAERVRMLSMMQTPTDYAERKKAFVDLALARAAASEAEALLVNRVNAPKPCPVTAPNPYQAAALGKWHPGLAPFGFGF